MRILIAEDDPKLLKSLVRIFEMNNYSADGVDNGIAAYDYAASGEYDGLVFDVMMPGDDGISVLRRLRAEGITTPALLLTAKTEVSDRVSGLDAGADDYLPKPFATAELLARVRAMLRRRDNFTPDTVSYNGLLLNRSTYEIVFGKERLPLSGKEFQILEMLMEKPGAVLSPDVLITHIWGWDANVDTSVIWVHISNIRKKLCELECPVNIRFLRGAGYVMEALV